MPDAETDTTTTVDEIDYFNRLEIHVPWQPIIDDDSAMIAAHALIELVARRTPEALGDSLAELHALTSLIHQLNSWVATTIADALAQHHSPSHILAQLTASQTSTPAQHPPADTQRRRHVYNEESPTTQGFLGTDSR